MVLPPRLEDKDATFKLAREGSKTAQDSIVLGYMRYVYKKATAMAQGADRDELIGESLLAILELVRRFPELPSDENLDGLIKFRIKGACLDYYRKRPMVKCDYRRNRISRHSFELTEDMLLNSSGMKALELSDQLRVAFTNYEKILELRMQGKTQQQISNATGYGVADVCVILQAAYERWLQDEST